jgi:hypothetical protein
MKTKLTFVRCFSIAVTSTVLCLGTVGGQNSFASGKAVDPIGAPSTGGGGGTGGGGNKPAPKPAPAPVVTVPLTFTPVSSYDGVVPACTGSYRVDPYYPTLSLMTMTVQASSVNVPDGTILSVNVVGAGGSFYGAMNNAFLITAQSGSCVLSQYVTPGSTVKSVTITDANGTIVLSGQ